MNKTILILLGVVLVLMFTIRTMRGDKTYEKPGYAKHQEGLAKVKTEPKVKDAVINSAGVLYAVVFDDGTRRDGYAEYLCNEYKSYGVEAVKIIKYGTSTHPEKDNAYGILLGESRCN